MLSPQVEPCCGGTGVPCSQHAQMLACAHWSACINSIRCRLQATDRAFRIGQTRNVFVHRLITQATFEERINHMIQEKKQLVRLPCLLSLPSLLRHKCCPTPCRVSSCCWAPGGHAEVEACMPPAALSMLRVCAWVCSWPLM